jgi:hypothetical protein
MRISGATPGVAPVRRASGCPTLLRPESEASAPNTEGTGADEGPSTEVGSWADEGSAPETSCAAMSPAMPPGLADALTCGAGKVPCCAGMFICRDYLHLLTSKWLRHKSNIACSSQAGLLTPPSLFELWIACCLSVGFAVERFRTGLKRTTRFGVLDRHTLVTRSRCRKFPQQGCCIRSVRCRMSSSLKNL